MSITPQTVQQINDNIIAQLEAQLNQVIPLLPKSFLRVIAKVIAAVYVILYKYGGFIFLQIFVSTASALETSINGKIIVPIIEWGRLIGVGDPVLSVNAELQVDVTVDNQSGILAAGSQGVNADNGVTYITTVDVVLNAAVVQVNVRASEDQADGGGAGVVGNLDPGAIISFVNPIAQVQPNMVVLSTTVTGANGENVDVEYRQRVVDRFKKRPQGGSYSDLELWGEETPGVIFVFPYTGSPGEVDVFSEVSADIEPDGIPNAATLLAVLASIEQNENGRATRRPANMFVNSLPISRTGFDVDVQNLIANDLPGTKIDITNAVTEFLLSREPFIDGLTILPKKNVISQNAVISVIEDIVALAGGTFQTATFKLNSGGGNLSTYTLGNGEKSKLVDMSFS